MAKKGKDKGQKVRSGERPKGPISKAQMVEALSTEATYDNLDTWIQDIRIYAGDADVNEAITAINKNIEEDIFYTKLFVMEVLAANAKAIEPGLLDKMVMLFTDNLTALRAASAHFKPSNIIEINALSNGLYLQVKAAGKDPAAFINGLFAAISKEEWEHLSQLYGKEPSNIPLLVAMKAMEENVTSAEWQFLQAIEPGYKPKIFLDDKDKRWDFKFVFDRVLDKISYYNDTITAALPFMSSVEKTVRDPEVKDNVLFWLTSRFTEMLTGNRTMDEALLRGLFDSMLAISKSLKPQAMVADRISKKVWDTLSETMKGQTISSDMKAYFAGIMKEGDARGQTARTLEKDIEAQLGTLNKSTAPNERFFAVDRLRSILSVNLVPLAPEIRNKAIEAILAEADKETDRIVRNGLMNLVLEAGSKEHLKALQGLLENHLDDQAWKELSNSQVNLEPYGELFYKEFASRTVALMGIVTKAMGQPPDEKIASLSERLCKDPDPNIRCLCFGYLLGATNKARFNETVLGLIESGIPFRAVLYNRLRPLFGPEPINGGIEFDIKESEADALVEFLKERYKDATDDNKARMRQILIQSPSLDMKDILIDDYRHNEPDQTERMTGFWLQLGFLEALGKKVTDLCVGDNEGFVEAYTQLRLQTVMEDPDVGKRMAVVDIFKVMRNLGLKIQPMILVDAVLNERLDFGSVIPAMDVLQEGDLDIFINETMNLFNQKLDGIECRLAVILTLFCPYIRKTHTEWYEKRWLSVLQQMVISRDYEGKYIGFWSERDRDLVLMWIKEDSGSDHWAQYIGILWNISDESFRIKKVVPAILKDWSPAGTQALGDLDRLDEPLDIITTDKAMAMLYEKVWDKFPDNRRLLMERWFSLEHFDWAYKRLGKAKGEEKEVLDNIVKAGLDGLANLLVDRYRDGRLDLDRPLPGSGPLVKVLGDVIDREPFEVTGRCTMALFGLLAGGWGPLLGKVDVYIDKAIAAKKSGSVPVATVELTYCDDPSDYSVPAILLRIIGQGHLEALRPLMRLLDGDVVVGMEGWIGSDHSYGRLLDLLVKVGGDPATVGKALEGHQELQLAYLLKLRKETLTAKGERPKPSDFGANKIIYDI